MPTDFPTQQQFNSFEHFLGSIVSALPWIGLAAAVLVGTAFLLIMLADLVLRILDLRHLYRQKSVLLELTPPASHDKTPLADQKLFSKLHGLELTRSWLDKLLRRSVMFTPEIASTREGGIRYLVRISNANRSALEKDLVAHSVDLKLKVVEDYMPDREKGSQAKVFEFRQTKHFAYPLQIPDSFEEHDPVGFLTNAMTSLAPGELIAVQLVLSPITIPGAEALARRLLHNQEVLHSLGKRRLPIVRPLMNAMSTTLLGMTGAVSTAYHGPSRYSHRTQQRDWQYERQVAMKIRPARTIGPIEQQQLANPIYQKLTQPLFRATIRVVIMANSKQREASLTNEIRSALAFYKTPGYQSLKARPNFPYSLKGISRQFMLKNRLPAIFHRNSCILAAPEIAAIYHFPNSQTAKTENVVKSLSRTLPAPPIVKKRADNNEFDIVLGINHHHGNDTQIGLTSKEREKHVYVIGGTGNGKTTLLEYAITQDVRNGKGVAIIDPHGDMAKKLLKYIPIERTNDVIYLNPVDIKHPIGINLLELPEVSDADDLLLEKERVAESVVSVLRKVFSDDEANAHRIEAILRNAIHTALTVEGATLFTVLKLLRNSKYRKEVIANLEDEDLKDFWQEEFGQAGSMQRVSMTKGVTNRIDRFRSSPSAKRMLGQAKSTINFEEIMDSGKILICNFAQGDIGEDTSALFGTTILAKLKMAAERRARMAEDKRKPFYVYVDEFQNFATTPFVKMLSSSRKYKLFLTIAEQSTKQQEEDRLTEAMLSNVSTVVCFRTGSNADEKLMLHRFEPFIEKGEISNLPAYNFYIRIQAQDSLEPMSGETVRLAEKEASESAADIVAEKSQKNYAIEYAEETKPVKSEKSEINKQSRDTAKKSGEKESQRRNSNSLAANDDE